LLLRQNAGESGKEGKGMRIKRRRLQRQDNVPADVEDSESEEKDSGPTGPVQKLKFQFECVVGFQRYKVQKAWIVPNTRSTLVVFPAPWKPGEWSVIHLATNYAVVPSAPSKAYALKLCRLILPYLDIPKLTRNFWDLAREAIPEKVQHFINHVWRADYTLEEIPTVKQWYKSGLKNSHQKFDPNRSRGKIKVKKAKRRR
jgi:hypothetical protein